MTSFGTPNTPGATRLLLLGSGELGKEVAIEAQRFGIEVIAADRYANAPAMQVAHHARVLNMLDPDALRALIAEVKPHLVVPEIEAIHTPTLVELEKSGLRVIPTARAAWLTMDREGHPPPRGRRTRPAHFAIPLCRHARRLPRRHRGHRPALRGEAGDVQFGQGPEHGPNQDRSRCRVGTTLRAVVRAGQGRVIVEGFVRFDYEITLLTVRHVGGIEFCDPIGHLQIDGDYRESWQPQPMRPLALQRAREIARAVVENLGGYGLFGVELFVAEDDVWFSEVSPRPHDTGLVTLISQELSEFALHARAILGLPIPGVRQFGPSASCALLAHGHGVPRVQGMADALREPETALRLFGKPRVEGHRRIGVTLARAESIEVARAKARAAAAALTISLD
jgi:phosphoribosylglycinamide formyltransferase 2